MGYYPRTDISKNVDGMLIEISVSGLAEDEVDVELVGSSIVVRGQIPDRDDHARYTTKELYRGRFVRTYPFNTSQHNLNDIECTMDCGLLKIFVPYKATNKKTNNVRPLEVIDITDNSEKENENGST